MSITPKNEPPKLNTEKLRANESKPHPHSLSSEKLAGNLTRFSDFYELAETLGHLNPIGHFDSLVISLEKLPAFASLSENLKLQELTGTATPLLTINSEIDCGQYLKMKPQEFSTTIRLMKYPDLIALYSALRQQVAQPPATDWGEFEQNNLLRKLAETDLVLALRIENNPLSTFTRLFEADQPPQSTKLEVEDNTAKDIPGDVQKTNFFQQRVNLLQPLERLQLYIQLKLQEKELVQRSKEVPARLIIVNKAMLSTLEEQFPSEMLPLKDAPQLSKEGFKLLRNRVEKQLVKQWEIMQRAADNAVGTGWERYLEAKQAAIRLDLFYPQLSHLEEDIDQYCAANEYSDYEFSYPKAGSEKEREHFRLRLQSSSSGFVRALCKHLSNKQNELSEEFVHASTEKKELIIKELNSIAQAKQMASSILQARADSSRFQMFDYVLTEPEALQEMLSRLPEADLPLLHNYLMHEEDKCAHLCRSEDSRHFYSYARDKVVLAYIERRNRKFVLEALQTEASMIQEPGEVLLEQENTGSGAIQLSPENEQQLRQLNHAVEFALGISRTKPDLSALDWILLSQVMQFSQDIKSSFDEVRRELPWQGLFGRAAAADVAQAYFEKIPRITLSELKSELHKLNNLLSLDEKTAVLEELQLRLAATLEDRSLNPPPGQDDEIRLYQAALLELGYAVNKMQEAAIKISALFPERSLSLQSVLAYDLDLEDAVKLSQELKAAAEAFGQEAVSPPGQVLRTSQEAFEKSPALLLGAELSRLFKAEQELLEDVLLEDKRQGKKDAMLDLANDAQESNRFGIAVAALNEILNCSDVPASLKSNCEQRITNALSQIKEKPSAEDIEILFQLSRSTSQGAPSAKPPWLIEAENIVRGNAEDYLANGTRRSFFNEYSASHLQEIREGFYQLSQDKTNPKFMEYFSAYVELLENPLIRAKHEQELCVELERKGVISIARRTGEVLVNPQNFVHLPQSIDNPRQAAAVRKLLSNCGFPELLNPARLSLYPFKSASGQSIIFLPPQTAPAGNIRLARSSASLLEYSRQRQEVAVETLRQMGIELTPAEKGFKLSINGSEPERLNLSVMSNREREALNTLVPGLGLLNRGEAIVLGDKVCMPAVAKDGVVEIELRSFKKWEAQVRNLVNLALHEVRTAEELIRQNQGPLNYHAYRVGKEELEKIKAAKVEVKRQLFTLRSVYGVRGELALDLEAAADDLSRGAKAVEEDLKTSAFTSPGLGVTAICSLVLLPQVALPALVLGSAFGGIRSMSEQSYGDTSSSLLDSMVQGGMCGGAAPLLFCSAPEISILSTGAFLTLGGFEISQDIERGHGLTALVDAAGTGLLTAGAVRSTTQWGLRVARGQGGVYYRFNEVPPEILSAKVVPPRAKVIDYHSRANLSHLRGSSRGHGGEGSHGSCLAQRTCAPQNPQGHLLGQRGPGGTSNNTVPKHPTLTGGAALRRGYTAASTPRQGATQNRMNEPNGQGKKKNTLASAEHQEETVVTVADAPEAQPGVQTPARAPLSPGKGSPGSPGNWETAPNTRSPGIAPRPQHQHPVAKIVRETPISPQSPESSPRVAPQPKKSPAILPYETDPDIPIFSWPVASQSDPSVYAEKPPGKIAFFDYSRKLTESTSATKIQEWLPQQEAIEKERKEREALKTRLDQLNLDPDKLPLGMTQYELIKRLMESPNIHEIMRMLEQGSEDALKLIFRLCGEAAAGALLDAWKRSTRQLLSSSPAPPSTQAPRAQEGGTGGNATPGDSPAAQPSASSHKEATADLKEGAPDSTSHLSEQPAQELTRKLRANSASKAQPTDNTGTEEDGEAARHLQETEAIINELARRIKANQERTAEADEAYREVQAMLDSSDHEERRLAYRICRLVGHRLCNDAGVIRHALSDAMQEEDEALRHEAGYVLQALPPVRTGGEDTPVGAKSPTDIVRESIQRERAEQSRLDKPAVRKPFNHPAADKIVEEVERGLDEYTSAAFDWDGKGTLRVTISVAGKSRVLVYKLDELEDPLSAKPGVMVMPAVKVAEVPLSGQARETFLQQILSYLASGIIHLTWRIPALGIGSGVPVLQYDPAAGHSPAEIRLAANDPGSAPAQEGTIKCGGRDFSGIMSQDGRTFYATGIAQLQGMYAAREFARLREKLSGSETEADIAKEAFKTSQGVLGFINDETGQLVLPARSVSLVDILVKDAASLTTEERSKLDTAIHGWLAHHEFHHLSAPDNSAVLSVLLEADALIKGQQYLAIQGCTAEIENGHIWIRLLKPGEVQPPIPASALGPFVAQTYAGDNLFCPPAMRYSTPDPSARTQPITSLADLGQSGRSITPHEDPFLSTFLPKHPNSIPQNVEYYPTGKQLPVNGAGNPDLLLLPDTDSWLVSPEPINLDISRIRTGIGIILRDKITGRLIAGNLHAEHLGQAGEQDTLEQMLTIAKDTSFFPDLSRVDCIIGGATKHGFTVTDIASSRNPSDPGSARPQVIQEIEQLRERVIRRVEQAGISDTQIYLYWSIYSDFSLRLNGNDGSLLVRSPDYWERGIPLPASMHGATSLDKAEFLLRDILAQTLDATAGFPTIIKNVDAGTITLTHTTPSSPAASPRTYQYVFNFGANYSCSLSGDTPSLKSWSIQIKNDVELFDDRISFLRQWQAATLGDPLLDPITRANKPSSHIPLVVVAAQGDRPYQVPASQAEAKNIWASSLQFEQLAERSDGTFASTPITVSDVWNPGRPGGPQLRISLAQRSGTLYLGDSHIPATIGIGPNHAAITAEGGKICQALSSATGQHVSYPQWDALRDRSVDLLLSVERGKLIVKIRPGGKEINTDVDPQGPLRILQAYLFLLNSGVPDENIQILGLSDPQTQTAVAKVGLSHKFGVVDLDDVEGVKSDIIARRVRVIKSTNTPSNDPVENYRIPVYYAEYRGSRFLTPDEIEKLYKDNKDNRPFLIQLFNRLAANMSVESKTKRGNELELLPIKHDGTAMDQDTLKTLTEKFNTLITNIGMQQGPQGPYALTDQQVAYEFTSFLSEYRNKLPPWMQHDNLNDEAWARTMLLALRGFDSLDEVLHLPAHFRSQANRLPGYCVGYRDAEGNSCLGSYSRPLKELLPRYRNEVKRAYEKHSNATKPKKMTPAADGRGYVHVMTTDEVPQEHRDSIEPFAAPSGMACFIIPEGELSDDTLITVYPYATAYSLSNPGAAAQNIPEHERQICAAILEKKPGITWLQLVSSSASPLGVDRQRLEVTYHGMEPYRENYAVLFGLYNDPKDPEPHRYMLRMQKMDERQIKDQLLAEATQQPKATGRTLTGEERSAIAEEAKRRARAARAAYEIRNIAVCLLEGIELDTTSFSISEPVELQDGELKVKQRGILRELAPNPGLDQLDMSMLASEDFLAAFFSQIGRPDAINLLIRRQLNDGHDVVPFRILYFIGESGKVTAVIHDPQIVSPTAGLLQDLTVNLNSEIQPDPITDCDLYAISLAEDLSLVSLFSVPSYSAKAQVLYNNSIKRGFEELRARFTAKKYQFLNFFHTHAEAVFTTLLDPSRDFRTVWARTLIYMGEGAESVCQALVFTPEDLKQVKPKDLAFIATKNNVQIRDPRNPTDEELQNLCNSLKLKPEDLKQYQPIDQEKFLAELETETRRLLPLYERVQRNLLTPIQTEEGKQQRQRLIHTLKLALDLNRRPPGGISRLGEVERIISQDPVFPQNPQAPGGSFDKRMQRLNFLRAASWLNDAHQHPGTIDLRAVLDFSAKILSQCNGDMAKAEELFRRATKEDTPLRGVVLPQRADSPRIILEAARDGLKAELERYGYLDLGRRKGASAAPSLSLPNPAPFQRGITEALGPYGGKIFASDLSQCPPGSTIYRVQLAGNRDTYCLVDTKNAASLQLSAQTILGKEVEVRPVALNYLSTSPAYPKSNWDENFLMHALRVLGGREITNEPTWPLNQTVWRAELAGDPTPRFFVFNNGNSGQGLFHWYRMYSAVPIRIRVVNEGQRSALPVAQSLPLPPYSRLTPDSSSLALPPAADPHSASEKAPPALVIVLPNPGVADPLLSQALRCPGPTSYADTNCPAVAQAAGMAIINGISSALPTQEGQKAKAFLLEMIYSGYPQAITAGVDQLVRLTHHQDARVRLAALDIWERASDLLVHDRLEPARSSRGYLFVNAMAEHDQDQGVRDRAANILRALDLEHELQDTLRQEKASVPKPPELSELNHHLTVLARRRGSLSPEQPSAALIEDILPGIAVSREPIDDIQTVKTILAAGPQDEFTRAALKVLADYKGLPHWEETRSKLADVVLERLVINMFFATRQYCQQVREALTDIEQRLSTDGPSLAQASILQVLDKDNPDSLQFWHIGYQLRQFALGYEYNLGLGRTSNNIPYSWEECFSSDITAFGFTLSPVNRIDRLLEDRLIAHDGVEQLGSFLTSAERELAAAGFIALSDLKQKWNYFNPTVHSNYPRACEAYNRFLAAQRGGTLPNPPEEIPLQFIGQQIDEKYPDARKAFEAEMNRLREGGSPRHPLDFYPGDDD